MSATCGTCGTALTSASVLYDEQGAVICQQCLTRRQVQDDQAKAARKVKAVAYSGPVLGLVGLLFNPLWLISFAAILNGIYVLRTVRQPETAKLLATSLEKMKVAAIAGIVLGAVDSVLLAWKHFGQ